MPSSPGSTSPIPTATVIRVPGAFSKEPKLHRRAMAAAKKLSPEEERLLRATEVQRAVSSRGALSSEEPATLVGDDVVGAGLVVMDDARSGQSSVSAVVAALSSDENLGEEHAQDAMVDGMKVGSRDIVLESAVSVGDEVAATGDGRRGDCPRRRVQAAPEVLAFLTKEYSSRAVAAAIGAGNSEVARSSDTSSEETRESDCTSSVSSVRGPSSALFTAAGVRVVSPPPPPFPRNRAKPMSKSLAKMLAQRSTQTPVENSGSRRMVAPSLGFLDELKAKGAAKMAPSSTSGASIEIEEGVGANENEKQVPARKTMGGRRENGAAKRGLLTAGGLSFLDELKARASKNP